jgi:hypothetical protein
VKKLSDYTEEISRTVCRQYSSENLNIKNIIDQNVDIDNGELYDITTGEKLYYIDELLEHGNVYPYIYRNSKTDKYYLVCNGVIELTVDQVSKLIEDWKQLHCK